MMSPTPGFNLVSDNECQYSDELFQITQRIFILGNYTFSWTLINVNIMNSPVSPRYTCLDPHLTPQWGMVAELLWRRESSRQTSWSPQQSRACSRPCRVHCWYPGNKNMLVLRWMTTKGLLMLVQRWVTGTPHLESNYLWSQKLIGGVEVIFLWLLEILRKEGDIKSFLKQL